MLGTQTGLPIQARLTLNGKDAPVGLITVNKNTLYELVVQDKTKNGRLEITANAPGLEAYAFTFGN